MKMNNANCTYSTLYNPMSHQLIITLANQLIKPTMKNTTSINPITQLPANGSVAFAIDDFTPTTHLIQVQWYQAGTSTNHTAELCRSCFEQWLEETGRLDYYTEPEEDNYSNLPTSGTNDTDSYWQYADYQTQTSDIKAFILAEVRAQQDLS